MVIVFASDSEAEGFVESDMARDRQDEEKEKGGERMVQVPETKCKHGPSAYNEVREGKGTKGINQIYKQRIEVWREGEEARREERE